MGTFTAQVNAAIAKRKDAMRAIFQEAAQRTVEIAQTPGPSVANPGGGQGGALPISSGFLRASLQATLGAGLPARPNPNADAKYAYDGGEVNLVIAGADLSSTITVAYTASYSRIVHRRYQWVTLAAQRWQQTVDEVAAEAQRRLDL